MRALMVPHSPAVLLVVTVCLLATSPAQAEPIRNPDNCQGPVTIGVATCPDKPGHWVECTTSGDYMCCIKNDQGGKDCEQIETKTTNPLGGVKGIQGGVLENPTISPSPKTSRFPKTRARRPIFRRGIEGDQPAETTPAPSDTNSQPDEGTK
jgi:hypothetical protein